MSRWKGSRQELPVPRGVHLALLATRYDFPALKDGRVKREELPDETVSGGQGWFFNTRREKSKDPRVREALNYAFDFEWTNKNIMYGCTSARIRCSRTPT